MGKVVVAVCVEEQTERNTREDHYEVKLQSDCWEMSIMYSSEKTQCMFFPVMN